MPYAASAQTGLVFLSHNAALTVDEMIFSLKTAPLRKNDAVCPKKPKIHKKIYVFNQLIVSGPKVKLRRLRESPNFAEWVDSLNKR